jgi:hypothetical protein
MLLLLIEPPIVENSRADTEILLGLMREIVPLLIPSWRRWFGVLKPLINLDPSI